MKRPWQVWLLFALGLALVIPPMAWLTVKALELDRAELAARQQIELDDRVSRALWRMDVLLMPLLAQEAARPAFVYRPLVTTAQPPAKGGGKEPAGGKAQAAGESVSPLLLSLPDYVLVHFELCADGSLTSPQNPPGKDAAWAADNGISPVVLDDARQRLAQLQPSLDYAALLSRLPQESLPPLETAGIDWNTGVNNFNRSQIVANTFDQTQAVRDDSHSMQQAAEPANAGAQVPNSPPGTDQQAEVAVQQALQPQPPEPEQQQTRVFANNPRGRMPSRFNNDLASRGQAYQSIAQRAYQEQRQNWANMDFPLGGSAMEGVSQPLWVGERLILARRVKSGDETLIQGCWLDWQRMEQRLREEVADLQLPDFRFVPLADISAADQRDLRDRKPLLATVPVEFAVAAPPAIPAWDSPIRVSLLAAWGCLLMALAFAAVTLRGVVALSERRGAFVAAVTHELRTPLTTFRMYAEMLAEGMVPSAEQRQKYLETLRREADRLAHLVENVLQYARLERGKPTRNLETLSVGGLLDRIAPRLADRAEQAEMKLVVEADEPARDALLRTDSGAVEQILFNLVDNACKYAAAADDKQIHVTVSQSQRHVRFIVRDHGPGISRPARRKLFRPFSKSVQEAARTAPGVGLGLALSQRLAIDLGGRLELSAADGAASGAEFVLTLPR